VSVTVETYADTTALVIAAGDRLVGAITRAIAARDRALIVLTGGGTGIGLLKHVAENSDRVDWTKVRLFWGDERFVPRDDDERNEKQAREALLDHVDIPPENIHPMAPSDGEFGDNLAAAVQAYRGWMHVVVGATQLAERDFALAIELDAANGDAHNGRGFVRAIQGDFAGAIEDAENALKLGPRSPQLVYNAARIHAQSARSGDLRVFDLIRESLSLLPQDGRVAFWSRQVRTDAALDSIRRYPQYLQMERELLTQN